MVKFESTKSLASTSSRSLGGALSENGDREAALQSVLTFIAEQQKCVHAKDSRPCSISDATKEFNIEAPPPSQHIEDLKNCERDNEESYNSNKKTEYKATNGEDENYVTLKQLCAEFNLNEQNTIKEDKVKEDVKMREEETMPGLAYAEEVCLVTPIDVESENCSNIGVHPVDICSSVGVELTSSDYQQQQEQQGDPTEENSVGDNLSSRSTTTTITTSESLTSSVGTPDTVVSKIPRRKNFPSKIPVSPAKIKNQPETSSKIPKSKIPFRSKTIQKQKIVHQISTSHAQPVITTTTTTEKVPPCASAILSNIIDGPPHRAVSFHERATSKDVIDELNRMIKNGDENVSQENNTEISSAPLDEACKSTGWIHVEKDVDLGDPKVSFPTLPSPIVF